MTNNPGETSRKNNFKSELSYLYRTSIRNCLSFIVNNTSYRGFPLVSRFFTQANRPFQIRTNADLDSVISDYNKVTIRHK